MLPFSSLLLFIFAKKEYEEDIVIDVRIAVLYGR